MSTGGDGNNVDSEKFSITNSLSAPKKSGKTFLIFTVGDALIVSFSSKLPFHIVHLRLWGHGMCGFTQINY